jgi:hypothetical protein
MPDISMCHGDNCSKKEQCYRFTAKPSEFLQSYFSESPIQPDGSCEHFWDNEKKLKIKKRKKKAMCKGTILIGFNSLDDVCEHYEINREDLNKYNVVYCYYLYENWTGNSELLLEKDGKLFVVSASHCSCYGLERQFEPEEISVKEIEETKIHSHWDDDMQKFWLFAKDYVKKQASVSVS